MNFFVKAITSLVDPKKDYSHIGAIAPFSRVTAGALVQGLVRDVLEPKAGQPLTIVEFGGGPGNITRKLLAAIEPYPLVQLVVFEVDDEFREGLVEQFGEHPQFRLASGGAETICNELGENSVDDIVCTLPFSSLQGELVKLILESAKKTLKPSAKMRICQYSPFRVKHIMDNFGSIDTKQWILWNMPPTFIYTVRR